MVGISITDTTKFPCRLKVEDDKLGKDKLAAWACIRLDRLASGYRFLKLFDAKGTLTDGFLLIKIEKFTKIGG